METITNNKGDDDAADDLDDEEDADKQGAKSDDDKQEVAPMKTYTLPVYYHFLCFCHYKNQHRSFADGPQ